MFLDLKKFVLFITLVSFNGYLFSTTLSGSSWFDTKEHLHHTISKYVKKGFFYSKIALEGTGSVIAGHMTLKEFAELVRKFRDEKIRCDKNQLYGQAQQIILVGGLVLITHKCLNAFINDVKKL
jgi:hypothetical protein